jgi:hypothetical protein
MNKGRVSLWLVLGGLALPFFTFPKWGFESLNESVREVPLFLYTLSALFLVVYFFRRVSKGFFLLGIYLILQTLWWHTFISLAVTMWIIIFMALVLLGKELDSKYNKIIIYALTGLGIIQVCYALIQTWQFDPLFFGFQRAPARFVHGTLGHHNFLGAYLAMIIPLAPLAAIPILVVGLFLSNSLLSFIAAGIGFGFRLWHFSKAVTIYYIVGVITLTTAWFWAKSYDSFFTRKNTWSLAFGDHDKSGFLILFGNGPGSWYTNIPTLQKEKGWIEYFYQAHNEYLQFFYETGFVGILLLGYVFWEFRRAFRSPAVIALAISCAGIYLMHLSYMASTALVILILALNGEERWQRNSSYYWV